MMKREKRLSPEEQKAADDAYVLRAVIAPQVRNKLSLLGMPWKNDIAGATAAALGMTVDALGRLESGELLPGEGLPEPAPWRVPHPFGEIGELSRSVLLDVPGLAEKVGEELARVDTWTKLTNFPEILSTLRLVDADAADKLATCADPNCGCVMLCPNGHFAQHCRRQCWLRICPACAKNIAKRLRDKLSAVLVEVQKAYAPSYSLKHLVLTLKRTPVDVAGLGEDAALHACAAAAQRDVEDLHDLSKSLLHELFIGESKLAGASAYAEFGPMGGNVHAHVITYSRYVDQSAISDHWRELSLTRPIWQPWVVKTLAELQARKARYAAELAALGKSRCLRARRLRLVVHGMTKRWLHAEIVRRAKRAGVGDCVTYISRIDADRAVAETVKYITKLFKRDARTGQYETPVCDLVALHLALRGRRRAWSWGSFFNVDVIEPEEEDQTQPGTCPKCGATLLGVTVAEARLLLHSRNKINCGVSAHLDRAGALARAGPGP